MGWPITHSRSPQLHAYWLEKYGIDGVVVPLSVPPERLVEAVSGLAALGFRGFNVTIPHKETIIPLLDTVTPVAERIGAVNTVTVGEDGHLEGTNTDAFGFMAHLEASVPDLALAGLPVVIFGAGGASRAVVAALLEAGVSEIRLLNRTMERAQAVAAHFADSRITVADWDTREYALDGVALLVNTTALGMTGKPALEINLWDLPEAAIVYDLVYAPLITPLLDAARRKGCRAVDGLGMLLHQARPGFKAWFGRDPEVDESMRQILIADLGLTE